MSTRLRALGTKALAASQGKPDGSAVSDTPPAGRLQASALRRIAPLQAPDQRWLQAAGAVSSPTARAGMGYGFTGKLPGLDMPSLYSAAGGDPAIFRWNTGADLSQIPYGAPVGAWLPTGQGLVSKAFGGQRLALAYGLPTVRRGLDVSV